jgi:hypothetical protein
LALLFHPARINKITDKKVKFIMKSKIHRSTMHSDPKIIWTASSRPERAVDRWRAFLCPVVFLVVSICSLPAQTAGWVYTGSLKMARAGHTATLLNGGVLVVAGSSGPDSEYSSATATCELYSLSSGTWSMTAPLLNSPRIGHTATLLTTGPNAGRVLVTGGRGAYGSPLSDCELFNPANGTWSETGSLQTARYGHTATLLNNGMVLVAAGSSANGSGGGYGALSQYELYDPASGTWCEPSGTGTVDALMYSSHVPGFAATLLNNGEVLVVDSGSGASRQCLTCAGGCETYSYNSCGGTWTQTAMIPSAAGSGFTATLLASGQVLAVGSGTGTYLYNNGTWTPTEGPMNVAAGGQTATLLNNGWVLVAGGNSDAVPVNSVEIWPGGGSWTETSPLQTARSLHTATLLPSGEVLVVGGQGSDNYSLASCELYTPPSGNYIIDPMYTFTGGGDGENPQSTLIPVASLSGNTQVLTLYGTTYGSCASGNYGTVFKINPDGTGFATIHTFSGQPNDGNGPMAGLVESPLGPWVFGTTCYGGANNNGMIFAINVNDNGSDQTINGAPTYVPICSFGSDANYPEARLTVSYIGPNNWVIYGTASGGNGGLPSIDNGCGAIFKVPITVNGNGVPSSSLPSPGYEILYGLSQDQSIELYDCGYAPISDLLLSGNWLYGTCSSGGSAGNGAIFAAKTDGSKILGLYSWGFGNATDPGYPMAGLLLSGTTLYGTTFGVGQDYGSIFAVQFQTENVAPFDPIDSSGTLLWSQPLNQGPAGSQAMGDLCWEVQSFGVGSGLLLGTFTGVPASPGHPGGVFEISTDDSHFAMFPLDADGDAGWNPVSGLCAGSGPDLGTFYGTASSGPEPSLCSGVPGTGALFTLHLLDSLRSLAIFSGPHFPYLVWEDPPNVALQSAPTVTGPWKTLVGTTPPYTISNMAPAQFFRLAASATNLPVLAPAVATLPVSGAGPTNAILEGQVTPNGANSTAWFQYGTNTAYGDVAPAGFVSATNSVFVSQTISGLTAGLTYHYQLVASNSAGIAFGADATFSAATPGTVYVGNDLTDPAITNGAPDGGAPLVILGEYSPAGPLASASPSTTLPAGSVQDVKFYGGNYNFTLYALSIFSGGPKTNEQSFRVVASQSFSNTGATPGIQILAATNFFVNSGDILAFAGQGPFYPQTSDDSTNSDATYQNPLNPNSSTATPPGGPGFVFSVGTYSDTNATYGYITDFFGNQGRRYGIGVDVMPTWP